MKITILGSGTSTGVPVIGCKCPVCTSADPHDRRLRTSVLVDTDDGKRILFDCGPDFREQMLGRDFRRIDGVLLSHEHYDHVGGLDDLRPFCSFGNIDVYCESYVSCRLRERIPYCFRENKYPGVPSIVLRDIEAGRPFAIGANEILPVRHMHAQLPILGFRMGGFAYITDMKTMAPEWKECLKGLELLVVNALRIREHHSHQSLSEALGFVSEVKPARTLLVHMSHSIGGHSCANELLPDGVELAFDGQVVEL